MDEPRDSRDLLDTLKMTQSIRSRIDLRRRTAFAFPGVYDHSILIVSADAFDHPLRKWRLSPILMRPRDASRFLGISPFTAFPDDDKLTSRDRNCRLTLAWPSIKSRQNSVQPPQERTSFTTA